MRRALPLALLLTALAPASALAKAITRAEVCGAHRCVDITRLATPAFVEGSFGAPAPAGIGGSVRVRFSITGEGADAGDTFTNRFDLATGRMRNVEGHWMEMDAPVAAALRAAARDVAAPASPARAATPSGPPWLALAGVALLAALTTRLTLRRRAAHP